MEGVASCSNKSSVARRGRHEGRLAIGLLTNADTKPSYLSTLPNPSKMPLNVETQTPMVEGQLNAQCI